MIKVLHTGDLHIGSYPGPEINGENARYLDICKCLDALVSGAQQEKPDIAVVAGDIFHQARVWSDRGLKEQRTAVKFLRDLSKVCPVVVMRGTPNHDSEEQFKALKSTFAGDDGVHIVTEPGVETYHSYDGKAVQIACVPGFDRGYYRARHPGLSKEEENEVFTRAIADMIIGLAARCDKAIPSVLVSHFTITGCNMESGQTAFFSQFEPVVYPDTLVAASFDLTCFGHIHRPQQLDGCNSTFYCGAISALNFNDEGQERGYYIHEIDGSSRASLFFPLPTRQFKTIRLNDEDVTGIVTGEKEVADFLDRADDINGKIVRVLYDCTDEHNKAFNHAAYEASLYRAGAFWVQEITPQKITVTVDRRSLDAEETPEDNLTNYLAEKGMEPEHIGRLVELARPIISEATEKAETERRVGAFVPVEIEVHNYRNYQDETFQFDPVRFCTINGSNGVGKSSLFMDAMLDALYEEPREGELTGWIRNDPEARSGAIKFTFKLGDRLYRVTRTRQKSGKATLNIAEQVDGEWVDRSQEKFKDTQQEIINIIGMDSLTLKACALIMQDQYGLFLQADKEARMAILGSILGLGTYGDMEDAAAEKATEVNRAIRSLADRAAAITAGLPDEVELYTQIAEHEAARDRYEQQAADKEAEVSGLKVELNTQLEVAQRVIRLNSKLETLTSQVATKEAAKTSQAGIITAADAFLAGEAEIVAGLAAYNAMLEREKDLIERKATYENLVAQRRRLEEQTTEARRQVEARLSPIRQALAQEAALAEKHQEYEAAAARLAEMEAALPDYQEKKSEVDRWEEETARTDRDYKEAHARLTARLDALKAKVEFLNDSGCPDIERATCRFLADALAAKEELPDAEQALCSLDEEHDGPRKLNENSLFAAKQALVGCLYNPEEVSRLKAVLRGAEAAERDYQSLEAKRSEQKLLLERLADINKAWEDAETAEKLKAEEMEALAKAGAEHAQLQVEMATAQQWVEKERQLPVMRERKAAAARRVDELTEEIKAAEAEIAETREELEHERAKATDADELKRRVADADVTIKALREMAQGAVMELGRLNGQAEAARAKRAEAAELQDQMNDLGGKAAGYEELKKAFSQDGIPHNIIRSIIPVFEATATNILGQMSGGHMSVEFVTEKVLKSNSKKEVTALDIIINDSATGRLPYMSRSGGERVKAALSVILALSEIKSSKAGIQLGFLFIDEPPFLDADGTQAYCGALETIQQRYPDTKIMAITHDETFKARFPQSVTVYKDEHGSHVKSD